MMYKVFISVIETFMIFGVGAFVRRIGVLDRDSSERISTLTMDVFFPMLTFSAITRNFKSESVSELWLMPLLGFGIMLVGALVGGAAKRFMRDRKQGREATFFHICAINNYVFLPIIILQNAYGDRHVALLLLMNVGSTVGFWTIGIITLSGVREGLRQWRNIFSVNILAVVLALLVVLLGIPIPEPADFTCRYLGDVTVPVMLVAIGAMLYECFRSGNVANWFDMGYLTLMRLVAIPAVVVALLWLLRLPREVFQTAAVVAVMPAACASVLVAGRFGGERGFAARAIIITTLISLATIPLWGRLIESLS